MTGNEKLVLKSSAIPTKFPNRAEPKRRLSSVRRAEMCAKKQCLNDAFCNNSPIKPSTSAMNNSQSTQCSIEKKDFSAQHASKYRSKGTQCQSSSVSDKSTQTNNDFLSSTINDDSFLYSDDQITLQESDISYDLFDEYNSSNTAGLSISYSAFIVFWSSILILLKRCIRCGEIASIISHCYNGTMIQLSLICRQGHKTSWSSQPVNSNGNAEGNIRMASGILFSGNTYTRIAETFSYANIRFFTKMTFYR